MHDEVSETENLRKNLAVERMIVEGCDILLDVNQVFVRQGELRAENTHNHYMFKFKPNANKKKEEKNTHTHLIFSTRKFIYMYQKPYISTVNTKNMCVFIKMTMQSKCVRVFFAD